MAYSSVIEHSFRPMTTIQKFNVRDTSGAIGINDMVQENNGVFDIDGIVNVCVCNVHNDMVQDEANVDYKNYFLIDKDGSQYYTSSDTLFDDIVAICNLITESEKETGKKIEAFSIVVKEFPSKKQRQGFMKANLKAIIYEDGEVEE